MSRDRGSATVWVLCCCVLVVVVGTVAIVRASAVLARHRAESAADLAALAAAQRIGLDGALCPAAERTARRNGTRVRSCRPDLAPDGRSGSVVIAVVSSVRLPVVGSRRVTATARAGRLPAASASGGIPGG